MIEKFELELHERIFNSVMLSPTDWIIRTHNKIIDFRDGKVSKVLEINDYGEIIDTYWGGNYALSYLHGHILLIGIDKVYAWDRTDHSFKMSQIANELTAHRNFPDCDLRPFRATTNDSNTIAILLQTQSVGDSPFWAELEVSDDLSGRWIMEQPKHLNRSDYPLERYQLISGLDNIPDISDIAFIGDDLCVHTTGFHRAYGKYDMDYSILSRIDGEGRAIGKQYGFESSFGYFSSDKKWLILKPLYKKGETKGKQFLFDLETNMKKLFNCPRGLSDHRILDVHGGTMLLSNDSKGKYPDYTLPESETLVLTAIKSSW